LASGLAPQQAFARGIAAGSAAVMRYGTAHPQREDIEELYRQIIEKSPSGPGTPVG